MHDLVRLYASEHLTENAAEDSFRRVLDLYALTTDVAWKRFVTGTNPPGVDPFPTASSALEWVLAERSRPFSAAATSTPAGWSCSPRT